MKVVINRCYGGFSLSPLAVSRLAELKGRPCHFFKQEFQGNKWEPISLEEAKSASIFWAFDIPNPQEVLENRDWIGLSTEERQAANALHATHEITSRPDGRADADLVRVVEKLGQAANGSHADLRVVEIPDGIDYEIDEYDGMETIHEKHRSWL